jgi:hypothetical protein
MSLLKCCVRQGLHHVKAICQILKKRNIYNIYYYCIIKVPDTYVHAVKRLRLWCNGLFTRLGNAGLIRDQRYRTDPDADAELKKLTADKNADAGLNFVWHSGIYV